MMTLENILVVTLVVTNVIIWNWAFGVFAGDGLNLQLKVEV